MSVKAGQVARAEERIRLALKAARVGIWDWDIVARSFYLDATAKALLGYADEEILNDWDEWAKHIHPEDRDAVMATTTGQLDGRGSWYVCERRMLHKDGSTRWILARGTIVRDAGDQALRVVGTDEDVTERKLAIERLENTKRRLRTLADSVPACIAYVNRQQRYEFVNATYEAWHNIPAHELRGRHVRDVLGEDPFTQVQEHVEAALDGHARSFDYLARYKYGKTRHVHVDYVPDRLPDGTVAGFYALISDISDQKRIEEKLRRHQDALQQQAAEILLAEERERRRIAVGLHDNTLQTLAAIRLKLESIRERLPGEDRAVRESLDLLGGVVQATKTLTFELSPPVLYELGLAEALKWLGERFTNQHDIDCIVKAGEIEGLEKDVEVLLFQNVQELLRNAHQHGNATEVRVSLTEAGDEVQLLVEDNGMGFDPSSHADGTGEHAGFGLANIRNRLRFLEGRIEIDSGSNAGTRIRMLLPRDCERRHFYFTSFANSPDDSWEVS